jgi:hypothetical protein
MPRADSAPPNDDRPAAIIALKLATSSAERGAPVLVSGSVQAAGEPCALTRVDLSLRDASGVESWLGSFPTDESGKVEGRVTVPFEVDVGDYQVLARTPGSGRCGPSR